MFVLVAIVTAATHFVLRFGDVPGAPHTEHHWSLVATAGISTLGIILVGSAYRLSRLGRGGAVVAESLGGRLVPGTSTDDLERRCLNVVEEMAIASGMPMPALFVLDRERSINAFAAGWSIDDAVIGVTRGALDELDREELQGVIAHEFSHILNRDAALNLRALGVLHGIVVLSVVGRVLMRVGRGSGTSRRDTFVPLVLVGFLIWVLGSLGALVAGLIQAAISREREFLADASAVQFTRNPEGLAGALAAASRGARTFASPRADELRHMLFSEPLGGSWLNLGASHPPLEERIRRILPEFTGPLETLSSRARSRQSAPGQDEPSPLTGARQLLERIPGDLRAAAESPFSARALLLACVFEAKEERASAEYASFGDDLPLLAETQTISKALRGLPDVARLPLFDIALGSLAQLSSEQRAAFAGLVDRVAESVPPRAFRSRALSMLLGRQLSTTPRHLRSRRPMLVKDAIEVVLGVLAHEGHPVPSEADAAFSCGASHFAERGSSLTLRDRANLTVRTFVEALDSLEPLPQKTRARVLAAARSIAEHDGKMRAAEAELLRTIATCLEVPL